MVVSSYPKMQAKAGILYLMKRYTNHSLAKYTSLKVGGPAKTLIVVEPRDTLADAITAAKGRIWVLGGGTNTLISDHGLNGTVIINTAGHTEVKGNLLTAESGANWDDVVQQAITKDLYGLELMSGIPGTVGGAIVGNIAAYGQKIADSLDHITVFDTNTRQIKTLKNHELDFDYRSSNLQHNKHLIVLTAVFELSKTPTLQLEYESALTVAAEMRLVPHTLKDRRSIIMETRKRAGSLLSTNGRGHYTAGSFFRNPIVDQDQVEKILSYEETGMSLHKLLRQNKLHSGKTTRVSAAHVLLAAGFKRGQTWGKVQLHPDHILKIENTGGATAQDIYDVVELIVGTVKSKLHIELIPEVQFIGTFQ
jgi:UDP-N-acetylmuramate dehydrogenase